MWKQGTPSEEKEQEGRQNITRNTLMRLLLHTLQTRPLASLHQTASLPTTLELSKDYALSAVSPFLHEPMPNINTAANPPTFYK